ncbi:solute carrier family 49 member A3 [Pelomyxa schiedti]|nr:solute carrier family 49 member A3 [Pelomyxa schiedti]
MASEEPELCIGDPVVDRSSTTPSVPDTVVLDLDNSSPSVVVQDEPIQRSPPEPDAKERESPVPNEESAKRTHNLYNRRFVMLFFIGFISLTNSSNLLAFTVIASQAAEFWKVNIALVNALVALGDGLSLVAAFVIPYFVDQRGLLVSSVVVNSVNVLAGWLRFIGAQSSKSFFVSMFIGQAFSVLAMFVNAQMAPRLASLWFPGKQRTIATAVQNVSWQLGLVLGIILGDQLKDSIWTLLLIQAIINTVPALGVPFMRDQPPLPPQPMSEIAEGKCERSLKEGGLLPATKALITNPHWVALVLSTGVPIGVMSAVTTLIQQLLPENMQSKAALFSILFFLCGIGGSIVFATIADRTKRYYLLTVGILLWSCIACALFLAGTCIDEIVMAVVFYALLGFSLLGLMPVVTEFAIEVSFSSEIHMEARSTAYLWLVTNTSSIVLTFSTMPSVMSPVAALITYVSILGVCNLSVLCLVKAPYRRLQLELEEERASTNGCPIELQNTTKTSKKPV